MLERWLIDCLCRWVAWVVGRAWLVLALLAGATCVLGWLAVDRFRMNSDLGDLVRQEGDWRDDFDRFEAAFPDLVATAALVVSGSGFVQVEDAALQLEAEIRRRPERFRAVYAGQNHPFFREHALLFLDEEALDDAADRLAEAQPWLTAVAEDPSLRGILKLVADGVAEEDPPSSFDTLTSRLQASAEATAAGADPSIPWANEFFEADPLWFRIIFLKSSLPLGETEANAELVRELREIIAGSNLPGQVRVGITGEVALAHEEIEAAMDGVQTTGWLAVLLLAPILILGVRSVKIILAAFAMLSVGILWTSAHAMLTVGEYNTLSIVFLVMFFGLGADFSIHFSLRYQEAMGTGAASVKEGLVSATRSVGGAICICTMTTALGFLGFWPTDYRGLADLGLIAAGGMVIAGFLAFTLLPAFYAVCGPIKTQKIWLPNSRRLVDSLIAHQGKVVAAAALIFATALALASQSRFDYSVLALKDPASDSMQTLRLLQEQGQGTDYALSILSENPVDEDALEGLPVVDAVLSLADFVPENQPYKLQVLADLQEILWSALNPLRQAGPPSAEELRDSVRGLLEVLQSEDPAGRFSGLRASLEALQAGPAERLQTWQQGVVANLLEELQWLRRALAVGMVEAEDLPAEVHGRMVNAAGQHVSMVLPEGDIAPVEALTQFVEQVRSEAPAATGRAVIEWGVGKIVLSSFLQAMAYALASIALVLLVMFQSLRYAALILVPLTMAVAFTLAAGVLFDMPLNMTNILVMPLIFGLGVDNGIHVVDRYRGEGDVPHLMRSSTPKAVLLSTLTTVGAFVALSFSPHQGTASIGMLLAIAVTLLLLFTVFLLPVLLSWAVARMPQPAQSAGR